MAADLNLRDSALLSDDDDLLVYSLEDVKPSSSTFDPTYNRFNINQITDEQAKVMFRFTKEQITQMVVALGIPPVYKAADRSIVTGHDGLRMLLRRLVYPNRLCELDKEFGRPKSVLSAIITTVLEDVYSRFRTKFTGLDAHPWMTIATIRHFADAVHEKGAALRNCWGFIDSTPRPICRPTVNQRLCFSGHKRVHCLKFQSVVAPNGLIVNLYGPVEGRRHDSGMLRMSNLLAELVRVNYRLIDNTPMCLYGDPAYPIRDQLLAPFRGAVVTDEQRAFNKSMSAVRECVEWQFGKIVLNFAFLDFKKNLKLYLQPVGKLYMVGALFSNCHTCLNGSVTSTYFSVDPPALEDYLTLQ
ncbi:uncharacterized protein LOC135489941 [Lineus longissimus]|uniref:uncharacterized protein LOC135489941 n=1 Tax=Lineus longissimus TaxID=88925 RepID=UPI00315D3B32